MLPVTVSANANVDKLAASDQPVEQASVTVGGSVVVSTSSASTVTKPLQCPSCNYSCLPRNIQRHCINRHNMWWQGIGRPLREPLESEMEYVNKLRNRFAAHQQSTATPDTESQSQNQLSEDSVLPVTSSPLSSVSANANVDTLPASNQPLEQALVTIEGSIVVSTSSASTLQSSSLTSVCASSINDVRLLAKHKRLQCPICNSSLTRRRIRQHCIRRHNMVWQGIGLPLREPLESEMGYANTNRLAAHKQSAATPDTESQSQNQLSEDSVLPVTLSPPSSVSANANVDTLPASDQPLEQVSVTVEGSIVMSTSSASTVQSSSLTSVCVSSTNHERLLANRKTLQCPNCNFSCLRPRTIRRHSIQSHSLVWQGNGLPLREPLESEMGYANTNRLAAHQQSTATPDTESQSQNQLSEDSVLPVTLSLPSSVSANANVDTLPASNQPLEQASVAVEGSVVVSTSSASTVQSSCLTLSVCASSTNRERLLTKRKTLRCPICDFSCLRHRDIQRHCIRHQNMVCQGKGRPLREPLDSEMGYVNTNRLAALRQSTGRPDAELQSQNQLLQDSTIPVTSSLSTTADVDSRRKVKYRFMLNCPSCDYVAGKYCAMQNHCIRQHNLVFQGKDLPCRQSYRVEKKVTQGHLPVRRQSVHRRAAESRSRSRSPGDIPSSESTQKRARISTLSRRNALEGKTLVRTRSRWPRRVRQQYVYERAAESWSRSRSPEDVPSSEWSQKHRRISSLRPRNPLEGKTVVRERNRPSLKVRQRYLCRRAAESWSRSRSPEDIPSSECGQKRGSSSQDSSPLTDVVTTWSVSPTANVDTVSATDLPIQQSLMVVDEWTVGSSSSIDEGDEAECQQYLCSPAASSPFQFSEESSESAAFISVDVCVGSDSEDLPMHQLSPPSLSSTSVSAADTTSYLAATALASSHIR